MPFRVFSLESQRLCVLSFSGLINKADFDEHLPAIAALPGYGPDMDELVVLMPTANLDEVDLEAAHTQKKRLFAMSSGTASIYEKRRAVVASNEVQYAFIRMFEGIACAEAPPGWHLSSFRQLEEAICWIEAGRNPATAIDRDKVAACLSPAYLAN